MTHDKIKNIQDAIEIQNKILRIAQHQIREAEKILEENQAEYKTALQEKLHLQQKLIDILKKE